MHSGTLIASQGMSLNFTRKKSLQFVHFHNLTSESIDHKSSTNSVVIVASPVILHTTLVKLFNVNF